VRLGRVHGGGVLGCGVGARRGREERDRRAGAAGLDDRQDWGRQDATWAIRADDGGGGDEGAGWAWDALRGHLAWVAWVAWSRGGEDWVLLGGAGGGHVFSDG
jgi:hypothetical protein